MEWKMDNLIITKSLKPPIKILRSIEKFISICEPYEINNNGTLFLYFDKRSKAYYITCKILGNTLIKNVDLNASIDGDEEDIIYKLNRDIYQDAPAFTLMKEDALNGRSFEDLVIEFDLNYNKKKPLKVYGGQHRIKAIEEACSKDISELHGVRIYFNLTRDQKVEIATVNNTTIAVPNDLLDRMREQQLGTNLRDWCQKVELLSNHQDFSDRKEPILPTVRIARTLIINYYKGLSAKDDDFHQPIVSKSGGRDDEYEDIRKIIKWDDKNFVEMGKNFARLHKIQRERVLNRKLEKNAEYARKALSLTVVASWGFASGLFQRNDTYLKCLYKLPDSVNDPNDPLNAKALSKARHKGVDPDRYRGLGTRTNAEELGRMLEVFIIYATKARNKVINEKLANAAIKSYAAKKYSYKAQKEIEDI